MSRPTYYCGNCASEAVEGQGLCQRCGSVIETRIEGRRFAALFLNELANLVRGNVISSSAYEQFRSLYYPKLGVVQAPAARVDRPTAPVPTNVKPGQPRPSPVPSWLVQQAPNLLLYLGAFLTVIAALVFVSARGGDISGGAKLAMLVAYTAAFTIIGALCYRVPRIRVAGFAFVAISSLLVPLNFAAAYNFVLEKQGVDGDVVWLSASLYSCLFYILLAALGLGRLYGFLSNAALVSAAAATAVVLGVPVEWRPPVCAALGICLLPAAWYAPAHLRDTFHLPSLLSAHFLTVASVVGVVVILTIPADDLGHYADQGALPITLAIAGAFSAIAGAHYHRSETSYLYGYAACAAFTASLAWALVFLEFPFEWIPAVFVAFASVLATASRLLPERFRSALGDPAFITAQLIAVASAVTAPMLATTVTDADRISVPVTLVLALAFFLPLSLADGRRQIATIYEIAVLTLAGAAFLSVPFVLDEDVQYFSAAFAGIAGLYAAAALAPVDRTRYRADILWVFALTAATAAWLPFLYTFEREPWFGAGAALGAAAVYLAAALAPRDVEALRSLWRALVNDAKDGNAFELDWLLLPAFAAMLGLGYAYFLLAYEPRLDPDGFAFLFLPFPLAFAVAGLAVGQWSQVRSRIMYVVAFGYSIFVPLGTAGDWGKTALVLAIFAGVACVIAVREREPRVSYLALAYAVFALVFALVQFQPADEVWPIPFVALSLLVYTAALIGGRRFPDWAECLSRGSFAVALVAPAVGFGLLQYRVAEAADNSLALGFSDPPLYLWSTATVAIVGVLAAIETVRSGGLARAYGSSLVFLITLLLVIGYFTPDNPQAYTVPIGIYLLGLVWSVSHRGAVLSSDVRTLLSWTEVLAGGILLGTTLLQAIAEEALTYHFLLLGGSIVYLLIGLMLRRKLMVVPGLAFATVAAALFAFEGEGGGTLPPWAILAIVGGALLALGFLFLVRLDFWQRLQQTAVGWWRDWEEA